MTITQHNFGRRLRPKTDKATNWENLVDLANQRMAFVYQRLSSNEQVKRSIFSTKAQDALVDLASEESSWVTGTSLFVDGGYTCQ